MRVFILGGQNTTRLCDEISKRSSMEVLGCSSLSQGLSDIELESSIDKIVLFDSCLVSGDRLFNLSEVFSTVGNFSDDNCEVLLITSKKEIELVFIECLGHKLNCRCVQVSSVRGNELIDIIINKPKPVESSAVSCTTDAVSQSEIQPPSSSEVATDSISDVAGINVKPAVETIRIKAKEPETEPEVIANVVPNPEPELKKVIEKVIVPTTEPIPMPKQQKKTMKSLLRRNQLQQQQESLKDMLVSSKVLAVTGNNNSGVTSTASELFNTATKEKVSCVLVDFDFSRQGLSMYYDGLDTSGANSLQQTGLITCLNNNGFIDQCIYKVNEYGGILGCTTSMSCKHLINTIDLGEKISDLLCNLALDYKLVIIHLPIDILHSNLSLVKDIDSLIYCTNCTINGLYNIKNELSLDADFDNDKIRKMSLLYRKLRFVLCNVDINTSSNITPKNFLSCLIDFCATEDYANSICGCIERKNGFDDFKSTKCLYSNSDKSEYSNILLSALFK